MKASELIRIIAFSLVGFVLIIWGQPYFYRSGIPLFALQSVDNLEAWIGNYYTPGAIIVFAVSIASTLLWYILAAKAQPRGAHDVAQWRFVWWLILLFPVLSICYALYFYSFKPEAVGSLTTLFLFDVLFLYWFITATSSPKALMYIPPGAFILRRLFRD